MNQEAVNPSEETPRKFRFGCLTVLGIIAAVVITTALVTTWWIKHNIYASNFSPTRLSVEEQKILDSKLARLEESAGRQALRSSKEGDPGAALEPEAYSEEGASREISLTEKELNALIANRPDMAQRVAIDLADDLISVKLVVPMDEEILFLGGKTLRLNLGVNLSYQEGQPVVALQGVTLGGIPLPNAWLGNLKYKNLVEEFGSEQGFWKLFADGVAGIRVEEGHLQVDLKE